MPEPRRIPTAAIDDMLHELAGSLRDILREADDAYIEQEPEDAFIDLANRLVLKLADKVTIVPALRHKQNEAARRIFDVFSTWMQMQPDRCFVTRLNLETGRFEVTTLGPDGVQAFFQGGDVKDAYAQMAQVLLFEGGKI